MILRSLSLYAFLNAKVRAMAGALLSAEQRDALARVQRWEELIAQLLATAYREAVSLPGPAGNPRLLEKELLLYDISLHRRILSASHAGVRELVFLLLGKYDLQNFKAALRLWFQPSEREEEFPYLISETICHPLPIAGLAAASSFDDLLALLGDSPYRGPLLGARDAFSKAGNLLPLEIALDGDYYARLHRGFSSLAAADRATARRLLGTEIDIENVKTLIRLREHYRLPLAEILPSLLPHGNRINAEVLRSLALSADLRQMLTGLAAKSYREIGGFAAQLHDPAGLSLLERALEEVLLSEARAVFRSFPFTIGTILSYLIFKRSETRWLTGVIYSLALARRTA
jgi:vacuolar-type H+-ATPase subunit C/Vma6